MIVHAKIREIEDRGVDEVPVLHFATPHHDPGASHPIDEKRPFAGRIVGDLGERLEHSLGIGDQRLKHEHALNGRGYAHLGRE